MPLPTLPEAAALPALDPGRCPEEIAAVVRTVLARLEAEELPAFCWSLGMTHGEFDEMVAACLPRAAGVELLSGAIHSRLYVLAPPLFRQLAAMLLYERDPAADVRQTKWLAGAMAAGAFGFRHLWQDLGLENRAALGRLMGAYFPALAAGNRSGMPWKRFFFAALGQRLGDPGLMPPGCAACEKQAACHGGEFTPNIQSSTAATLLPGRH